MDENNSNHGMVHFYVADGGDGFQLWEVAIDISNKQ
jgi:hypothetical protein